MDVVHQDVARPQRTIDGRALLAMLLYGVLIDAAVETWRSGAPARSWVLAATILGSSMVFVDGTVVNVALSALQRALNATVTDVQWVVEAYALFLAALLLVIVLRVRAPWPVKAATVIVTSIFYCVAFFRASSSACWNVKCSNSPLKGGAACRAAAVASVGGGSG